MELNQVRDALTSADANPHCQVNNGWRKIGNYVTLLIWLTISEES